MVIASSANESDLQAELDALDAHELVDAATTAQDAEQSKPEPDILQAALDRAEVTPDEAIYIGDAVWDVQAAARLGMACIGLESGGTSRAELSHAGAVEVWRDPADLLDHFQESRLSGDAVGQTIERVVPTHD